VAHRRLGHFGDNHAQELVNSKTVKGMDMTNTHLDGICEECILSKMDEKLSKTEKTKTLTLWHIYTLIS